MTKRRDPYTVEYELERVAALIGWDEVARIAGRNERTVRRWSEPDEDRHLPAAIAVQLDIAWRAAGGAGLPFADLHRHHAEAAAAHVIERIEVIDLRDQYRVVRRESYEADDAVIVALPGDSPAACFAAVREIDDSIAAKRRMRRLLVAASIQSAQGAPS